MPTATDLPFPDMEAVAEETSAREVNTMLRAGWRLLVVVAAHDGAGGYPIYIVGKLRAATAPANIQNPAQRV